MPVLERRFELTPTGLPVSQAGQPYRLLGRGGTGLGLWGRMGMFVGRRHELDLLRACWASAERGHGQVVGLVGEPGVGKSRLLWEFTQLRGDEDCVVLQAGAIALGNPAPYLPIIELLREYFGIEGGGDPAAARDRIARTLSALDPSLGSTLSALAALLDIQGEDERSGQASIHAKCASAFSMLISELCLAKRAKSLSCSLWKTPTGSTPKRRRCSTVLSRVSQRHASSWRSVIVPNTSTLGGAGRITRRFASIRYRPRERTNCSRPYWARIPAFFQ